MKFLHKFSNIWILSSSSVVDPDYIILKGTVQRDFRQLVFFLIRTIFWLVGRIKKYLRLIWCLTYWATDQRVIVANVIKFRKFEKIISRRRLTRKNIRSQGDQGDWLVWLAFFSQVFADFFNSPWFDILESQIFERWILNPNRKYLSQWSLAYSRYRRFSLWKNGGR